MNTVVSVMVLCQRTDDAITREMKDSVTIQEVVDLLNGAMEDDPEAIQNLVNSRVECNAKLTEHPTIQVGSYYEEGKNHVGLLGIFNGLFGVDDEGWGPIAAVFDDDDKLLRFELRK